MQQPVRRFFLRKRHRLPTAFSAEPCTIGQSSPEVVAGQQVADFHFSQFQQLGIVDHIAFVHEHDDVRYAYLAGQQDVFAGLRHWAVGCGTYQDCTVHLCGAGCHVFNVVGVPRAVYVCVVAGFGFVFHVGGVNGNTACFFFGCVSIWS